MSVSFDEVEIQARQLSLADMARLVAVLPESFEGPISADVDALWDREIERRAEAFDRSGEGDSCRRRVRGSQADRSVKVARFLDARDQRMPALRAIRPLCRPRFRE